MNGLLPPEEAPPSRPGPVRHAAAPSSGSTATGNEARGGLLSLPARLAKRPSRILLVPGGMHAGRSTAIPRKTAFLPITESESGESMPNPEGAAGRRLPPDRRKDKRPADSHEKATRKTGGISFCAAYSAAAAGSVCSMMLLTQ